MSSLIEELEAQALDRTVPINDLLRKAKVVAEKLEIPELRQWVDLELNGYSLTDEYPDYRKIQGEFQAFNPYHGWQPIIFPDSENLRELFDPRILNSPVGEFEFASPDNGCAFTLRPELKAQLIRGIGYPTDVRCLLNHTQVRAIPEHVRNRILEWSIRLEKAGVRGDGLSFSTREKQQAHSISISVHGNVGNLSNVVDVAAGASVSTRQDMQGSDGGELINLAAQLRQHVDLLVPRAERNELPGQIEIVEQESRSGSHDAGKIRRALTSARNMIRDGAVSAGSTLITQGALALISGALQHFSSGRTVWK